MLVSMTDNNINASNLLFSTGESPVLKVFFFLIAIRLEFLKPLTDLEVKEKESARFECEISRPGVKVNNNTTFESE